MNVVWAAQAARMPASIQRSWRLVCILGYRERLIECRAFPLPMLPRVPRYVRGVVGMALLHAPDLSVHPPIGGIVADVAGKITMSGAQGEWTTTG